MGDTSLGSKMTRSILRKDPKEPSVGYRGQAVHFRNSQTREPLRTTPASAAGELLALQWDSVKLDKEADENGFWGTLELRRGLKRKERRRDLPITEDMAAVLMSLKAQSKCQHVFTSPHDHTQPLISEHSRGSAQDDYGKRHFSSRRGTPCAPSYLPDRSRSPTQNVRALQRLAGHSRIQTTMRYVHPDQSDLLEIAHAVQQARSKLPRSLQFSLHQSNNRQSKLARCRI